MPDPKVLYVDDDPAFARLVQRGLNRQGFSVEHVPDGDAALARVAEGGIDAVALDHYLADRTGLELLPQFRDVSSPPALIYVTGSGDASIAVAALKAGADDYVAKSVDENFLQLLATAIRQAVDKRHLLAQREAAERDIRAAKDRAELLLREVNHRVANSLALVSSLVGLQANMVAEPEARRALTETQARIYAVGEIHKRLYTANDLRFVQMDEYLADLVAHLDASLAADGGTSHTVVEAEPILIATDRAVSLGVVVTELVTNAFKYAYRPEIGGEVRVSLRRLDEERAVVAVSDQGAGWEEGNAIKGTGLGTRIVRAMATSLEAQLEYRRRDPGTEVRLSFAVA